MQTNALTNEQAQYLSKITSSQNTLESKTPQQLVENSKAGSVIIAYQNEIIGCIFLMSYQYDTTHIYERGSLWVANKFRGQGVGTHLMRTLTKANSDKPLVSLTTVTMVQQVNKKLGMISHSPTELVDTEFLKLLEQGGPVHSKYQIFMNQTMKDLYETIK